MTSNRKALPPPATEDVLARRFSMGPDVPAGPAVVTEPAAPAAPSWSPPAVTSGRRDVTAPPAAEPVRIAFTLRLTPDQADRLDTLVLRMRRQLGRGRLDKAAVLLALVEAADASDEVRAAALGRLRG